MIKTEAMVTIAKSTYEDLIMLATHTEVKEDMEYLLRCKAVAELIAENTATDFSSVFIEKADFNALMANELKGGNN